MKFPYITQLRYCQKWDFEAELEIMFMFPSELPAESNT